jgi:hypothetical protein
MKMPKTIFVESNSGKSKSFGSVELSEDQKTAALEFLLFILESEPRKAK